MSFLTSEIKKPLYWGLAWVLTFINFITFIVSRNEFWLTHPGQAWLAAGATEDRTYLASEFERNLSCYQPITCLRSGSAFLSQALIDLVSQFTELTVIDFSDSKKVFVILIVGLTWRLACVLLFFVGVKFLFTSITVSVVLTNVLMFLLSGLPMWLLGKFTVYVIPGLSDSISSRASDAFFYMAYQDLWFYDYGFIALIPFTIFALRKVKNIASISQTYFFLSGFLLAIFYEAFVPLIFVAITIRTLQSDRKIVFRSLWLVVGQLTWTVLRGLSIRYTEAGDPNSLIYTDTSLIGLLNTSKYPFAKTIEFYFSIAVQFLMFVIVALICGLFAALASTKARNTGIKDVSLTKSINAVTYATAIIIAASFLRGVSLETGRQSIGLTVAVVIYSFAATQNFLAKAQAKRLAVSTNSV